MPDREADAALWLPVFRRACDRIAQAVLAMPPELRAEPCGRGAGGDVTVRIDRVAEDIVLEELEGAGRPLHLVSEEVGERQIGGPGGPVVVVDPIDGSLNAKRGLPVFATSLAVAHGPALGDVTLGFVRDHGTGEEYVAGRGGGARLNGVLLRGPTRSRDRGLELLLVEGAAPQRIAGAAAALDGRVRRLRALGSLAISMCHAAAGRGEAMVGLGLGRAVDIAASQLVALEAGMIVGLPEPERLAGAPLDVTTRHRVTVSPDRATLDLLLRTLDGASRRAPATGPPG
jgi:myo-inositol-1(or 4)-monophosphatase